MLQIKARQPQIGTQVLLVLSGCSLVKSRWWCVVEVSFVPSSGLCAPFLEEFSELLPTFVLANSSPHSFLLRILQILGQLHLSLTVIKSIRKTVH